MKKVQESVDLQTAVVEGKGEEESQKRSARRPSVRERLHWLIARSPTFESENGGDHWYQEWKRAGKVLHRLSHGQLQLVSAIFRGEDEPHEVLHSCGRFFRISFSELKAEDPKATCPHCNATEDLRRFRTLENAQATVIQTSLQGTYFCSNNALGLASDEYDFYCLRHRRPYRATFQAFQESRPLTNACPLCMEVRKTTP